MLHMDTRPTAEAVQTDILQRMSGEKRILLALEMSSLVRDFAREGLRREHPNWPEVKIDREMYRLAFFPAPLPSWIP